MEGRGVKKISKKMSQKLKVKSTMQKWIGLFVRLHGLSGLSSKWLVWFVIVADDGLCICLVRGRLFCTLREVSAVPSHQVYVICLRFVVCVG